MCFQHLPHMKLFDPIIMTGIGFFYFLFGLVFSAEGEFELLFLISSLDKMRIFLRIIYFFVLEVIFSSRGAPDFNRWFSFGKDIEVFNDFSFKKP